MYSRKAVGFLRGIAIRIGRFFVRSFFTRGFFTHGQKTERFVAAQAFFSAKSKFIRKMGLSPLTQIKKIIYNVLRD